MKIIQPTPNLETFFHSFRDGIFAVVEFSGNVNMIFVKKNGTNETKQLEMVNQQFLGQQATLVHLEPGDELLHSGGTAHVSVVCLGDELYDS